MSIARGVRPALLPLINTYCDAPHQCDGKRHPAASPLSPVPVLAEVPVGSGSELMDMLKGKGYLAARATSQGCGGRATRAGYAWRRVGENITASTS